METCLIQTPYFSAGQIWGSGQCFRMTELSKHTYEVIAGRNRIVVEERADGHLFHCSREAFDTFWKDYFDLTEDYGRCIDAADPADGYMQRSVAFSRGVRILRQDLWEMIVTFIISSQNNIPRIRQLVRILCETFGDRMTDKDGAVYYSFPSSDQLAAVSETRLRELKFGYRSGYIVKTARMIEEGTVNLDTVRQANEGECQKQLLLLPGVGKKVAECIRLFGLHHLDAFPLDTHMLQMLEREYKGQFPFERYRGFNGVMQQYIFYYELAGRKGE